MPGQINFKDDGIGHVLADNQLAVPVYQRSYSWRREEENQVEDFWNDLMSAFGRADDEPYFLGTVVLTAAGADARLMVTDGQQRLATTSILMAAIRDVLRANGKAEDAGVVQQQYLAAGQLGQAGPLPRLILNEDDDDFYQQRIVEGDEAAVPTRSSHKKIDAALGFFRERLDTFVVDHGAVWHQDLTRFVAFLRDRALIVTVTVPTEADAFTIFETLNDRGAGLTVADLLKNLLFSASGPHLPAVRRSWTAALDALKATASDNEFATFLRHYWSSRSGVTRERDLYKSFKGHITSANKAREFARELEKSAKHYSALLSHTHEHWSDYTDTDREAVHTLSRFDLAPNKELMLAVMAKFEKAKVRQILRAMVGWSVRLLIEGTVNNSAVESAFCQAAVQVREGTVTTRTQLFNAIQSQIPGDAEFETKFANTRVSKSALARYYLAAVERHRMGTAQPELVPNTNTDEVNLEHVLPKASSAPNWAGISAEQRRDLPDRLGNLCLLPKGPNGRLGTASFAIKKPVLAASSFGLTAEVGAQASWGPGEIATRQAQIAADAVVIWPRLP